MDTVYYGSRLAYVLAVAIITLASLTTVAQYAMAQDMSIIQDKRSKALLTE